MMFAVLLNFHYLGVSTYCHLCLGLKITTFVLICLAIFVFEMGKVNTYNLGGLTLRFYIYRTVVDAQN